MNFSLHEDLKLNLFKIFTVNSCDLTEVCCLVFHFKKSITVQNEIISVLQCSTGSCTSNHIKKVKFKKNIY